ncbi:helix-turn-helix transcriptional regulator [Actinomadura sp. NPDC047616]|uniref:helix-turn-helix domain-containing protein n=1 Tax=Actinomadura sp. NPDC047616 TaxID=3155914 RepID=UPI0033F97BDB
MAERSPNIRERRLVTEIKKAREAAGLTLVEVNKRLGWSISMLSRIETHKRRIKAGELAELLDLYGVKGERRERLLSLARSSRETGWWDTYAGALSSELTNYLSLEAEAAGLDCYESMVFHGLLQTPEYAERVIRSGLMSLAPPQEVARRVEVRMNRQELLTRDESFSLWTVIDESVLSRMIGGPEVMRAQLEKVAEVAQRPNVTIQVLHTRPEAHPALSGTFSIMKFPGKYDADVVYVETMTGSLYVEDESDVHRYNLAFNQLRAIALGPDESVELITESAERL